MQSLFSLERKRKNVHFQKALKHEIEIVYINHLKLKHRFYTLFDSKDIFKMELSGLNIFLQKCRLP